MAVKPLYQEDQMALIYQVIQEELFSEAGLEAALDDLDIVFDTLIKDHGDPDCDAYFHAIEFVDLESSYAYKMKKVATQSAQKLLHNNTRKVFDDFRRKAPLGEFDPWNANSMDFWFAIYNSEPLRPRLTKWLEQLESMLKSLPDYDTIWENEEAQLGEPLVTQLAIVDQEFIPWYTRFLRHWDMDHEVDQNGEIGAIFAKHGVCAEFEELLHCRVAINPGQWGYGLLEDIFPYLQQHYGDFTQTPVFHRIVAIIHAKQLKSVGTERFSTENRNLIYTDDDALRVGVERVCAELDAAAGITRVSAAATTTHVQ